MAKLIYRTEPLVHQRKVLEESIDKPAFALLMDMGSGKTKVTIDTFVNWYMQGIVSNLIVIAPKGIYLNWIEELRKHCGIPYNIRNHLGQRWYSDIKGNVEAYIYLINIEAITTDKGWKFVEDRTDQATMLVIDESTKIKSPKIKRTKQILKLSIRTQYKRILSGYPAPNNIVDLYTQFQFLNKDITQCASWYAFRNTFCTTIQVPLGPNRPTFTKITGTQNVDILQQRISPYSYRVRKQDCLDLPDKVYQKYEYELSNEQQKAYNELRNIAISELANGQLVTLTSVISKILRLQQVCCGFLGTELKENYIFPENPRLKILEEIVEELIYSGEKVIIWSHFVQCIKDIELVLKKSYGQEAVVTYYGADSSESRSKSLTDFRSKKSQIFIGNPAVGGMGLTLTECNTTIYYSNSYNLEHRLQSEDRVHRIGQQNKCLYLDICAKRTVDEKVLTNLREKKKIGDSVIGDSWREWI